MLEVARLMETWIPQGQARPLWAAQYFALGGDGDSALKWLEAAFAGRVPQLMLIGEEPRWDLIRDDPRFQDLMERIGIPTQ